MRERLGVRLLEVLRVLDADGVPAHRLSDGGVVDLGHVDAEVGQLVDEHLELDHAERRVVEHGERQRQVVGACRQHVAHEHRQAAVTAHRDDLAVGVRELGADGLRQRVGHRAVQHRADEAAAARRLDVARGPHVAHARVGGDDRVVREGLVEQRRGVLGVDGGVLLHLAGVGAHRLVHELLVLLERLVEELRVLLLLDERQHGVESRLDVALDRQVDGRAAAEHLGARIDLHGARVGQELVVREVGADHDHEVGVLDALGGGAVAEQARHADVERVVVLHEVLAAQRVPDGRLGLAREPHELVVCPGGTGAGEDGDLLRRVDLGGKLLDDSGRRHEHARLGHGDGRHVGGGGLVGDVTGQRDDGDTLERDGVLDRRLHDAGALHGRRDELGVDAALGEETVGVGLLEVVLPDLRTRDVARDGEHRRAGAVRVVEAVDEVQVARAAGARADGEFARHLRVGGRGEGGDLLVAHVDPVDAALRAAAGAAHGVDDGVEAVSDDAVDAAHTGGLELGDDLFGELHRADSSGGTCRLVREHV